MIFGGLGYVWCDFRWFGAILGGLGYVWDGERGSRVYRVSGEPAAHREDVALC